jgi:16S rRNA (cytidine1402-2'-O)-methyltransferase
LTDALDIYGDRPAAVANDLTKRFENVQRGSLSTLLSTLEKSEPRGEYIVVIGGADTLDVAE